MSQFCSKDNHACVHKTKTWTQATDLQHFNFEQRSAKAINTPSSHLGCTRCFCNRRTIELINSICLKR